MSEESSKSVLIQAEISGYEGPAVNLLAALDTASGFLVIDAELPVGERVAGAMIVTNDPRAERDQLFTEEALQDAIRNFFRLTSLELVDMEPATAQHNPRNSIEAQGVDERGTRYRLMPGIRNGAIATLALVHAANAAYNFEAMNDFGADLVEMFATI
ncbi:hypothetical protein [Cupriavidus sp. Marseille-Q8015]